MPGVCCSEDKKQRSDRMVASGSCLGASKAADDDCLRVGLGSQPARMSKAGWKEEDSWFQGDQKELSPPLEGTIRLFLIWTHCGLDTDAPWQGDS